ncbi:hypothetical protein GOARA_061_01470 [Gordonia araii NBRC 100433]|uniref:DUF1648 domain-containing protein n=1 Tax=Gordonia araii NBRC 100433 TaxID=1073574 RepID=G7H4D2_9ACTN|nr:DUF1648 domain-containing protein [Gordonia araii]NNG96235.1 DUF1648 domain-containing protein [Gordonia araii NBRC 100433]GAB10707.1 hypothetical protein GOARA_061_01470 [Gordonia araii NBRC 100433]
MSAARTTEEMPRKRLIAGLLVVCLAIGAVGSAVLWSWTATLPDPMATHFGSSGPDGFTSLRWVVWQPLIVGAVCAAVGIGLLLSDIPRTTAQWLIGVSSGLTAGVVALIVLVAHGQRGLATAEGASLWPWSILIAIAAGVALGALAARLVPRWTEPPIGNDGDRPVADLRDGERFVWTRRASSSSPTAALAAVAVLPLVVVGWVTGTWALLLAAGITLLVAAVMWSVRVTVSRQEVSIRSAVGWPRIVIGLDEIDHAEVVEVNALRDYGGFGYRVGVRGRLAGTKGFVLRSGQALLLVKRAGGGEVVVVDDAETAAGLVNAVCAAR